MKCENHCGTCTEKATMNLPYARLCYEHWKESKKSFFALSEEQQREIRQEWKSMEVPAPW